MSLTPFNISPVKFLHSRVVTDLEIPVAGRFEKWTPWTQNVSMAFPNTIATSHIQVRELRLSEEPTDSQTIISTAAESLLQ